MSLASSHNLQHKYRIPLHLTLARKHLSFLRGCVLPGGPSGGNGGNGGAVWAVADESLNSLTSFRKQLHYRAQPGKAGGGSNMHGSNGIDLDIQVRPDVLQTSIER